MVNHDRTAGRNPGLEVHGNAGIDCRRLLLPQRMLWGLKRVSLVRFTFSPCHPPRCAIGAHALPSPAPPGPAGPSLIRFFSLHSPRCAIGALAVPCRAPPCPAEPSLALPSQA